MLHRALLRWLGRGSMETLMGEVADIHYGPALEQATIVGLHNPDPGVVADAARTLGRHGPPGSEAALWARLQMPDTARRSRAVIEQGLTQALATAQNWYASPARLKQIRALCVTEEGRRTLDESLQAVGDRKVSVYFEIGDRGYWTIGQYNGQGRTAFFAKLAQFPHGTRFWWQDMDFGPDQERLYTQARTVAHAHGQTLERQTSAPFPG